MLKPVGEEKEVRKQTHTQKHTHTHTHNTYTHTHIAAMGMSGFETVIVYKESLWFIIILFVSWSTLMMV